MGNSLILVNSYICFFQPKWSLTRAHSVFWRGCWRKLSNNGNWRDYRTMEILNRKISSISFSMPKSTRLKCNLELIPMLVSNWSLRIVENFQTSRKLSADEIVGQCLVFLLAGFDVSKYQPKQLISRVVNHNDKYFCRPHQILYLILLISSLIMKTYKRSWLMKLIHSWLKMRY